MGICRNCKTGFIDDENKEGRIIYCIDQHRQPHTIKDIKDMFKFLESYPNLYLRPMTDEQIKCFITKV